jgi:hypothetical protein
MFYFDNTPEIRTSYSNQRALAARDLPKGTKCIHDVVVDREVECFVCRVSGTVLVKVA